MLNIFVNTWGNYKENGADGGEWITLPMDADTLKETLNKIAAAMPDNDPEWAIHDYEWTTEEDLWSISEHENISELNETLEELTDLDEWDQKEIMAAIEAFGYDFKEAAEQVAQGRFVFYAEQNLDDVAAELADEILNLKEVPEFIARYFDYDAFARDLRFDGYTETSYGVIVDC